MCYIYITMAILTFKIELKAFKVLIILLKTVIFTLYFDNESKLFHFFPLEKLVLQYFFTNLKMC